MHGEDGDGAAETRVDAEVRHDDELPRRAGGNATGRNRSSWSQIEQRTRVRAPVSTW
jgi:hypothetical protein